MAPPIEDYGFLGDTQTGALVSKAGSIDWLCLPRFDSAGPFAAPLGEGSSRWRIAPFGHVRTTNRRYRDDTLVLETDFHTAQGSIRLVDFVPPRGKSPHVVRLVVGVRSQVLVHMELRLRLDPGSIEPWLRHVDGADVAVAGAETVWLRTPVETRAHDAAVRAHFLVSAGELLPFVLTWHPSNEHPPAPLDPMRALADTESFWSDRASSCAYTGVASA
jgi:GH15 family glucan-1,4-alpha-glucosidase